MKMNHLSRATGRSNSNEAGAVLTAAPRPAARRGRAHVTTLIQNMFMPRRYERAKIALNRGK